MVRPGKLNWFVHDITHRGVTAWLLSVLGNLSDTPSIPRAVAGSLLVTAAGAVVLARRP